MTEATMIVLIGVGASLVVGVGIAIFSRLLEGPNRLSLAPFQAMLAGAYRVKVWTVCPVCRGAGREGLRVDPREFTKHDDAKLKPEDFPPCLECKAVGWKEHFLLEFSPGTVELLPKVLSSVGGQSPPASTAQESKPSDSNAAGCQFTVLR